MNSDFEQAINYVLGDEGGFSNIPQDRGGMTHFGITEALLEKFSPGASISLLTLQTAKEIYKKYFWDPLDLGDLPQLIATAILDIAVNEGQSPAIKFSQSALGLVSPDGIMGPKTKLALQTCDQRVWLLRYIDCVQDRYADIVTSAPSQVTFIKGWLRRSRRLLELLP